MSSLLSMIMPPLQRTLDLELVRQLTPMPPLHQAALQIMPLRPASYLLSQGFGQCPRTSGFRVTGWA